VSEEDSVFVALGSNVGDRRANFCSAASQIDRLEGVEVVRASSIWRTSPVGLIDQPQFSNAVLQVSCSLGPAELLHGLLQIERAHGRQRGASEIRWGPRTLDLDLLLFGDRVVHCETLTVPHPRLAERHFVLEPLCELAPDLVHPVLEQSLTDLLDALNRSCRREQHHGVGGHPAAAPSDSRPGLRLAEAAAWWPRGA
jgi:2-amino-4-hydroxy-6-hydroxymethyldihydropteridine diphosphokinase